MTAPTGIYRRAWLVVASGGWWKASEIVEAIATEDEPMQGIHNRLARMVDEGYLTKRVIPDERREIRLCGRTGPRERVEFAVTPDCCFPLGIRVSEALRALNG